MLRLICLISLTVSVLGVSLPLENVNDRIVGGDVVSKGRYPFVVSMRNVKRDAHFCGGTILAKRWILTAAHCVYANFEKFKIVTGVIKLNETGIEYEVETYIYHNRYDPITLERDVALVKLTTDIVYDQNVQSIDLEEHELYDGTKLTVLGWGRTDVNSQLSNDLMELTYNVVDLNICKKLLSKYKITMAQLCMYLSTERGACKGDSGSPLITTDGKFVAGIVSYGIPCAHGSPDVYTKVFYYKSWITTTMLNN